MSTFDRDHTLPPIPVPELEDTCQNLKKLIKPLVGEKAIEEASKAIDSFLGVQGVPLQERLLQFAESEAANDSWLRPIWDDIYLSFRGMLPVNLNYTFKFVGERWGGDELPTLMSALARSIKIMRTGAFPEEISHGGLLSMDTLAGMIYTRIPGKIRDNLYYPPSSCAMTASVVCKGHWFILYLSDEQGNCLATDVISGALAEICSRAAAMERAPLVGAMTCPDREFAVELRGRIQMFPENRMNLERIEKSLFTVCLDEPVGESENFSLRLIAGDPENRWFDKSIQIISDGKSLGVNMEHSGCDAGIWVYLLKQADALIKEPLPCDNGRAHIRPLTWNIPEDTANKLQEAAGQYLGMAKKLTYANRRIADISKEKIKAMKCSPDAFVQLLYQTVYYKLTGCFSSVYEAAATRRFYQGRTDCVRPVTEESVAFVRGLCDGREKAELSELFHRAVQAHGERVKRAQKALGSERHMAGLSMMAEIYDIPLPDIFFTEGYKALRHDTLSTSSITAPYIDFFSFFPVVEDGIGIGYGIKEDALHVAISAYPDSKIDPNKFIDEMEQAVNIFYLL